MTGIALPPPLARLRNRLAVLAAALSLPSDRTEAWLASWEQEPTHVAGRWNPLHPDAAALAAALMRTERPAAAPEPGTPELGASAAHAPQHRTDPEGDGPATPGAPCLFGAFSGQEPPHPLARTAFVAPRHARQWLTHHPAFASGALYLQSLSSQWAVWTLDPQPGEAVLDLAAAPGGKTTLIAAAMGNQGYLAAVEAVKPRFFKLRETLARCRVRCARTFLADGRRIGAKTPARFDRVLLDAPCSSEARIRAADPTSWQHWSERKVFEAAHKQRGLLRSAFAALRPGGVLVYATCSYAPEENEAVLAHLLAEAPDAVLEPPAYSPPSAVAGLSWAALTDWLPARKRPALCAERASQLAHTRRVLPQGAWSGFFLARIRKAGHEAG